MAISPPAGQQSKAHADGVHYPGTYLGGGYNRLPTEIAGRAVENEDLVNLPNWLALELRVADEDWFDPKAVEILAYRRELDLRRGVLLRAIRVEDGHGRRSTLTEQRFVSMADMHLGAPELALTAENWPAAERARRNLSMTRTSRVTIVKRPWTLHVEHPVPDVACVELAGAWRNENQLPDSSEVWREIQAGPAVHRLTFDTRHVTDWDSGLVTFAIKLLEEARARGIESDRTELPDGVQRLLRLAEAVPERQTGRGRARPPWLARIGVWATAGWVEIKTELAFLGEGMLALGALLRGRARFRMGDLLVVIQDCGPRALGIVSLISFLVGLILAFVGAVQLQQFGASIFVANLVAIAMTREIGCMMTAVVMAGRTGAAFAAELGTMNTNQEIDALSTMGISPMEFLVLPRMMALILMMPLLTIYADLVGIVGGAVVGVGMLGLSPVEYFEQTRAAVGLTSFFVGVSKSVVFGVLVALVGCLRGMQSGRSAEAVGRAATSAVVTSIVLIVVIDGVFAVILNVLHL